MIDPDKMSKRKQVAMWRRRNKKGALDPIPVRPEPGEGSQVRKYLSSLPPLPLEREKDTRVQDEIRRTVEAVLNENSGGFHAKLPRRKIGLD